MLYFVRWKEGWGGGGWVIYWHVYVIVAICRGRKRENYGERVVRAGEKYRGCERVSRPRVNAQCITGLRGGRISPSNSTWIPEILTTETLRNHRSVLPFLHPFRSSPLLLPLSFNKTKAVRGMKMDPRLNITIEFFFPLILLLTITQISKEIFLLLRTYTIHVHAFKRSVSFWKLKFATSSRDSLEQR